MQANIGNIDRIIRALLGIALLAAGLLASYSSPWNFIADGVGLVLLLTASMKFCPAYTIIGASTCKKH